MFSKDSQYGLDHHKAKTIVDEGKSGWILYDKGLWRLSQSCRCDTNLGFHRLDSYFETIGIVATVVTLH